MGSIQTETLTQNTQSSELDFPDLPPFPDDVPVVPLLRIDLQRLLSNDPAEEERLFRACCDLGFFYLDLRSTNTSGGNSETSASASSSSTQDGIDGPALLSTAASLFDLATTLFSLPTAQKQTYDFKDQGSYFGYKGLGAGVIDTRGTTDRNEFWNMSKDDILDISPPLPAPALLQREESRGLLKAFILTSHAIVTLILTVLNAKLGLPTGTLPGLHRLRAVSGDQVRWVRAPPQPKDERQTALGEHTDFGSVTVLFNRLGGLQVLPPGQETWAYVRPLKGHCVINLGDAMVKFTAGLLRSNIHRVVSPPAPQDGETRYSLVYFNRPEDDVQLRKLNGSALIDAKATETNYREGEVISSKEWILRRALGRRVGGDYNKSGGTDEGRINRDDMRERGTVQS